jgi:hypothetical protein
MALRLTNDDRDDEPKLDKIRRYVPEPDSSIYLEGVRMGGTLLTAKADDRQAERAAQIMSGYNMVNMQDRARDWETRNPSTAWDKGKAAVQYSWER